MQSHVNAGGIVEDIRVRPHPADFAVLTFGHVEIIVESVADSEEIIKAALAAKDLLSPIWAIFDAIEGEVAGPKTYAEAKAYIKDNDSWHTGELTIGHAVTDLDAALSPPAALSDAEKDEAVMPPGHQLPAGEVTGWDEPLPPYHAKGGERCMSKDAELGYFCTAQRGHAGPLHVAYGFDEEVLCGWPVDAEVPAGSDAR